MSRSPLNVLTLIALIASAPLLSACTDLGEQLGLITAVPSATPPATPTGSPTQSADITTTPDSDSGSEIIDPEAMVMTVWMPEGIAPAADTPAGQELRDQIADFDDPRDELSVELYAKRSRSAGGIIAYLRSAPPVAPGMLPDVALVPRDSLIEATRENLIVPINTLLDPATFTEMYPVASALGMVDGQAAGLVYLMEFPHIVYREAFFESPPNTFDIVLRSPVPYLFPAGGQQTVSLTFLQQYMAAGGTLLDEDGNPHLDAEPLREVLTFYADARREAVIDTSLFQISDPANTWSAYTDRQAGFTTTTSSLYLADRADLRAGTRVTWIPTPDGSAFALNTGWAWVVVTRDPLRQTAALEFINHMMEPSRHGRFSQLGGWVPSQRTALNVWGDSDPYLAFANTVLINAQPMPDPLVLAAVGPALQGALEDVLLENALPISAATLAVETVSPDDPTP